MSEDWEKNWKNYKGPNAFGMYRLNQLVKKIKKYVPLPCNFIDIGIGPGDLSLLLKWEGYAQFGIDSSEQAIKICSNKGLNVEIGDAFKLKYPDKSFDMSLSDGLLEHFEKDMDVLELIYQHIRVSKKYIVISLPSTSITNTLYRWIKPYDVDEYRIPYRKFKKIIDNNFGERIVKSGYYNLWLSYYFILERP